MADLVDSHRSGEKAAPRLVVLGCFLIIVIGIDNSYFCRPRNVDFEHFVWQHFEQFIFKKCVMALLPSHITSAPPRLLFLR
jgi:hypothetical protein